MPNVWLKHYAEDIPHEVDIPEISLPDMLKDTVRKYGEKEALSFYGQTMTYKELQYRTSAFASALQKKGIRKGDRVAIMLPNCPQYVISYYGILTAGAVVTQVNPMLVGRELTHILNDSGARVLVIYKDLLPVLEKVQDSLSLENVVTVDLKGKEGSEEENYIPFSHFLASGTDKVEPPKINPGEDTAVLQYTGGTTGRSKGAMLTHRNLIANLTQTYEFFKHDLKKGEERYLTVIPLFHVFGMTACMNLSVYSGSLSVMLPRFELEEVLETIKREQPTSFPGVPTMYVALNSHPEAESYGIDSVKVCNSGSAPMPLELMRSFENKTSSTILEGYGLSETSPTTHVNPSFGERKPGSVGIPLPSTECKIVDLGEGIKELKAGETGEVIIKGPQVMKGYWNMPEETAIALRNGWLYTGDIGKMDEDGYLYIVDRKKDLIIASGYNIYPRDIEEVLYEHEAVQEAVAVGIPDKYKGEAVKAVVVFKDGKSATEEELISFCRHNMAAYKVPSYIESRQQLPKTNVGKILRRAIKEEARKQAAEKQSPL
ncbi:long-chain-fatty-acid--CoA ligase [Bacillus sp. FJAT-44742]|uniref:long-chain-fatty-acid--CoA ligase n=1 Tax=Bacillus sp. FJAT-44742 TaxID=2014005 RepID=UPI000C251671|nr:long-chain fatty acid--CoA ligase [Bacillus sp. FJAT-44742]